MKNAFRKLAAASLAGAAFVAPVAFAEPAADACRDMNIAIYFPAYDTDLTSQSESVVEEAGEQLKNCVVTGVSLNVLSEEATTDEDAALLSEARAENVMQAILANGIDASTYKADFSRMEAAAPAAKPMVEPMARRVNVAFKVQSPVGV